MNMKKLLVPFVLLVILCFSLPVYAKEEFSDAAANTRGAVVATKAKLYTDCTKKSEVLKTLKFGEHVKIRAESGNWYQVSKGKTAGYMRSSDLVKYDSSKKHIALTFDDGPGKKTTPTVISALKKNNCKATFFVVGQGINSTTGKLLAEEVKIGCEIGNHSYSHPVLSKASQATVRSQLSNTDKKIKKYTGSIASVCRAPYGSYNKSVLKIMNRPNIFWSIDTLDWKYRNTSRLISYVKKHAKDGAIVLMHDIHPTTAKAVDRICRNLKKKNYEMVTVTELAAIKSSSFKKGKTYSSF